MDRLTDEYIPVFIGLTEAEQVYGVVMFARSGAEAVSASVKIMFYVFDGEEIYNMPVSGVDIAEFSCKSFSNLYSVLHNTFTNICESIATYGINVYELRGKTCHINEFNSPTNGQIRLQKRRK